MSPRAASGAAARERASMSEHYLLISSDCHAGPPEGHYREYLDPEYREAYEHLRLYSELTPHNAWAWCWLGKACEGLGETGEAAAAYRRAVALEVEGSFETDAPELLSEKIIAAKEAAARVDREVFINARTDVYLRNLVPSERAVAETIARGQRFQAAGCDSLFVPGLIELGLQLDQARIGRQNGA